MPKGLPALFAALDAILLSEGEGIGKGPDGSLKAHSVFAEIAGRFGRVPLEPGYHAKMLQQKCDRKAMQ